MTHTTYGPDCACKSEPPVHEDDSYGDCAICREYVTHTDDEYRRVKWPCAVVKLDEALSNWKAASADANIAHAGWANEHRENEELIAGLKQSLIAARAVIDADPAMTAYWVGFTKLQEEYRAVRANLHASEEARLKEHLLSGRR